MKEVSSTSNYERIEGADALVAITTHAGDRQEGHGVSGGWLQKTSCLCGCITYSVEVDMSGGNLDQNTKKSSREAHTLRALQRAWVREETRIHVEANPRVPRGANLSSDGSYLAVD